MTLKVIHRLQAFSNAISRTFVQHFTQFQLTACSHGPSALAELLVQYVLNCYRSVIIEDSHGIQTAPFYPCHWHVAPMLYHNYNLPFSDGEWAEFVCDCPNCDALLHAVQSAVGIHRFVWIAMCDAEPAAPGKVGTVLYFLPRAKKGHIVWCILQLSTRLWEYLVVHLCQFIHRYVLGLKLTVWAVYVRHHRYPQRRLKCLVKPRRSR